MGLGIKVSLLGDLKLRDRALPPKVCKIMALMAIIMGLGLLFYILGGV